MSLKSHFASCLSGWRTEKGVQICVETGQLYKDTIYICFSTHFCHCPAHCWPVVLWEGKGMWPSNWTKFPLLVPEIWLWIFIVVSSLLSQAPLLRMQYQNHGKIMHMCYVLLLLNILGWRVVEGEPAYLCPSPCAKDRAQHLSPQRGLPVLYLL